MNNSSLFNNYIDKLNENSRFSQRELNNQCSVNIKDYSNCKFEDLKELISKQNDYSCITFLKKNLIICPFNSTNLSEIALRNTKLFTMIKSEGKECKYYYYLMDLEKIDKLMSKLYCSIFKSFIEVTTTKYKIINPLNVIGICFYSECYKEISHLSAFKALCSTQGDNDITFLNKQNEFRKNRFYEFKNTSTSSDLKMKYYVLSLEKISNCKSFLYWINSYSDSISFLEIAAKYLIQPMRLSDENIACLQDYQPIFYNKYNDNFSFLYFLLFNLLKFTPDMIDDVILLIINLMKIDSIKKEIGEIFIDCFYRYFIDYIEGYCTIEVLKPLLMIIFNYKSLLCRITNPIERIFDCSTFFTSELFKNAMNNNFENQFEYNIEEVHIFKVIFQFWIKSLKYLIDTLESYKTNIDLILNTIETLLKDNGYLEREKVTSDQTFDPTTLLFRTYFFSAFQLLIPLFTSSNEDEQIEIINKIFIRIHNFPIYYYNKPHPENLYMSRRTPCVKGRFFFVFESIIGMLLLRNNNDVFHEKVYSLLMKTLPKYSKEVDNITNVNILSFFLDLKDDEELNDFICESKVPPILQGVMQYYSTFIQIDSLLWKNSIQTLENERKTSFNILQSKYFMTYIQFILSTIESENIISFLEEAFEVNVKDRHDDMNKTPVLLKTNFLYFLITFITNCPNPDTDINRIVEKDLIHFIQFHHNVVKRDIINYLETNYYYHESSEWNEVMTNIDVILDKICRDNTYYKKGEKQYQIKSEYYSYYDPFFVKSKSCNTFEKTDIKNFNPPLPIPVMNRYNKNIINIIFTNKYNQIIIDTIKEYSKFPHIIEPIVWMIIIKIIYYEMNQRTDERDKYSESLNDLKSKLKEEEIIKFLMDNIELPQVKSHLNYIFNKFEIDNDIIIIKKVSEKKTLTMNKIREMKEKAITKYLLDEKGNNNYSVCYCASDSNESIVIPVNYQRVISYNYKWIDKSKNKYPLYKVVIDNKMNLYHIDCLDYQCTDYVMKQIGTEEDTFFSSVDILNEGEYIIPTPLCYIYYNLCLVIPVNDREIILKGDDSNITHKHDNCFFQQWDFNGVRIPQKVPLRSCIPLFSHKFHNCEEVLVCLTITLTDLLYKMKNKSFRINGYMLKSLLFNSQYYFSMERNRGGKFECNDEDYLSLLLLGLFKCKKEQNIYYQLKSYLFDSLLSSYIQLIKQNSNRYERIKRRINGNAIYKFLINLLYSKDIKYDDYLTLRNDLLNIFKPHLELVYIISKCFSSTKEDCFIPEINIENVLKEYDLSNFNPAKIIIIKDIKIRELPSKIHLIEIPTSSSQLENLYKNVCCKNSSKCKTNGICLLCGKRVCLGKLCCKTDGKGEATYHSIIEHNSLGMYLSLVNYDVYLVRDKYAIKYLKLYDSKNLDKNVLQNKIHLLEDILSKNLILETIINEEIKNKLEENCL